MPVLEPCFSSGSTPADYLNHNSLPLKPKGSTVSRALQRIKNIAHQPFKVLHSKHQTSVAASTRAPLLKPAAMVDVGMGKSATVQDDSTILSTRWLSYCSALAVLSDWNGSTYGTRTLAHLTGSSLEHGLIHENVHELLSTLKASLSQGGKVIWVGGLESQSDYQLSTSLGQEDSSGRQPLMDLLNTNGVSVTLAGACGIDIRPDGTFELAEGGRPRGALDEKSIKQQLNRDS